MGNWEGSKQWTSSQWISLTVQCVKDGKPSVQCGGGGGGTPTVSQRVETDVDLAYQVVSAVCVMVYQPVRRRSKTQQSRNNSNSLGNLQTNQQKERGIFDIQEVAMDVPQ